MSNLTMGYTRHRITTNLTEWMVKTWGNPANLPDDAKRRWFENEGMINAFLREQFPEEPTDDFDHPPILKPTSLEADITEH
tara:strand:+ start:1112 stop:1354 length:243 start_codon:yes stop_codon:yes gene_type:complete